MALKFRLSLAVCIAALAFPASSLAASCAPPGNAGVDQYFETIPGANCNHSGPGSGGHHHGGGSLPPGTASQLSKQGAVGKAIKQLVASSGVSSNTGTGSPGGGNGNKSSHSGAGSGGKPISTPTANLSGAGRNALSGLLHPVLTGSTSGGIGVLLPVLLGGALAAALLTTVLRRRFRSTGPQT